MLWSRAFVNCVTVWCILFGKLYFELFLKMYLGTRPTFGNCTVNWLVRHTVILGLLNWSARRSVQFALGHLLEESRKNWTEDSGTTANWTAKLTLWLSVSFLLSSSSSSQRYINRGILANILQLESLNARTPSKTAAKQRGIPPQTPKRAGAVGWLNEVQAPLAPL